MITRSFRLWDITNGERLIQEAGGREPHGFFDGVVETTVVVPAKWVRQPDKRWQLVLLPGDMP